MRSIDLNADLGETVDGVPTADDEAMFAVVSSANVACGGHAGDADSMRASVARAQRFGVTIGAHPSYPDRDGFGRVAMAISPVELSASVLEQLQTLAAHGADIRYVKPHGALYHAVTTNAIVAEAVVAAVTVFGGQVGRKVPVLGMGGAFARQAERAGLPHFAEAFLDRGYLADGHLVPRDQPGALLTDPERVAARAVRIVREGVIETVAGGEVSTSPDSLCLHGDTPAAVTMAHLVRAALAEAGVSVAAPW